MALYVVFRVVTPEPVAAAIQREFPAPDSMSLGNNEWLISTPLPAADLADKIGIGKNSSPAYNGIVFRMGSYYGRAPTDVWDWIKAKIEAPGA